MRKWPPPCLRTAPHLPPWTIGRLRPLLRAPGRRLSSLEACRGLRSSARPPQAVAAACEAGGGYGAESELFCNHTFFCFDTCQGGAGVMPLNAVAEEGSFMMLFTGPELLELAKPALQQLGAFSVAPNVQIAQVHAKNVFDCLNAKDAMHAGVAVNVYVPGLDERYMAAGLRKAPLCKLFAHHGILV